MRPGQISNPQFREMLARSPRHSMTVDQRRQQLISFAYGNVAMEDSRVTREMVVQVYDRL